MVKQKQKILMKFVFRHKYMYLDVKNCFVYLFFRNIVHVFMQSKIIKTVN